MYCRWWWLKYTMPVSGINVLGFWNMSGLEMKVCLGRQLMSHWLSGYFGCVSCWVHWGHDWVVDDHSSVGLLLRAKMRVENRLFGLDSFAILQLGWMPSKMALFMQPSIFTNREHSYSILLRYLWLILWIQVSMLIIGPAVMTAVVQYNVSLLVFWFYYVRGWLLRSCVIIRLPRIHPTPDRCIMRIVSLILGLLGIMVVIAHNLINDLLFADIVALKLLHRHNSIILPVHIVIPLTVVVITVRALWIVVISVIIVRVWWLALKVVSLALLSLLVLHKIWVSLSLFGLFGVVYVFVLKLDSALLDYSVSIAQE